MADLCVACNGELPAHATNVRLYMCDNCFNNLEHLRALEILKALEYIERSSDGDETGTPA